MATRWKLQGQGYEFCNWPLWLRMQLRRIPDLYRGQLPGPRGAQRRQGCVRRREPVGIEATPETVAKTLEGLQERDGVTIPRVPTGVLVGLIGNAVANAQAHLRDARGKGCFVELP